MIKISGFSKKYSSSKEYSVKNVNLTARHGVTALIGPNGAGKSTLLKAIMSLTFPTEGKIQLSSSGDEKDLFDVSENEANEAAGKKCCGFVSENSLLPKRKTVYELLSDTLRLHASEKSREEQQKLLKKYVSLLELDEVMDKKINTLSRGFTQRSSIASAMIYEPENLILDEALSGLDPYQITRIRPVILEYAKKHTVLFSSHVMQNVSALSDNIYILNKGSIVFEGNQKALFDLSGTKDLEEAFLFCLKENSVKAGEV